MLRRLLHSHSTRLLVALLAASGGRVAGANNDKEWKGGNGNASNGNNYTDTGSGNGNSVNPPGRNDRVKHSAGQMLIDTALEFGSLEFTGGYIAGSSSTLLSLVDATSVWTGGELTSSAILNTPGLTIGAGTTKKISAGAKWNLSGTTSWTGEDITTGSGAQLNNNGIFNASSVGKIGHDDTLGGSRATFKNDGTFNKSSAEGTVEIEAIFNNNGSATVSGGSLKITGGGASSGNMTVAPGAKIEIGDAGYTFNGGTLGGSGTIELLGGNTTLTGTQGSAHLHVKSGAALTLGGNHTSTGNLALSSGTIGGNGTATVGALTWDGGTINGSTITTTGATLGGNVTKQLSGGAQLNLGGNTTWSADSLSGEVSNITASGSNTKIKNTGTFTTATDGTIGHVAGDTRATFRNEGTFQKTGGATGSATQIEATFENIAGASVNITGGSLKLLGGGSSAGGVTVNSGTSLILAGENFAFSGGALNGTGTIDLESATTTFSGTTGSANLRVKGGNARFSGTHSTTGSLTLESGQIDGGSVASVGSLDWTGGSIAGTTLSSSGATIGGKGAKSVSAGAQLNFGGNTTWSTGTLTTSGAATTLKNTGTLSINSDDVIAHDGGALDRATFRNEGVLHKSVSAAGGTTEIQAKFDNAASGAVNLDGGRIKLTGGGSSSGNFTIASAAALEISGETFAFNGGNLGGDGTIEISGATAALGGTSGSANLRVGNNGTLRLDGAHQTSGKLTLETGSLTGTGNATVGSLDWQSGTLSTKLSTAGGLLTGNAKTLATGAELTFTGNTTWDGSQIQANGTGKIKNDAGATFLASGDGSILNSGSAVFTNSGTFEKSGGSVGGATEIQTRFESTGEIKANTGTLKLSGGGNSSNNITLGTGARLEISGADFAITGGAIAGGAGSKLELADRTTTFTNASSSTTEVALTGSGANARFDGSHIGTGKLSLAAGAVSGNGSAQFGSLDFTGGSISGNVKSTGNATLGGAAKSIGGELTLGGNTTWDGSLLGVSGTGRIRNESGATFTATDGVLTGTTTGSFINSGTFEKTSGKASTDIHTKFESTGEIKATVGTLKLIGGGSSSNTVTLGSGAKIEISGADFAFNGGAINGSSGRLELADKITTFSSSTSGDAEVALTNSTATARFDGAHVGSGKLNLAQGTVDGTGTAEFGSLDWSGGALNGKVKSAGVTTISGGVTKSLAGELTLGGDTTWNGSQIAATGSAKIRNEAGKTFLASGDGLLTNGGNATFTNVGTFEKNAGSASGTEIQARFDSTGTVKASAGTLRLTGGGTASGNVEIASGAKLQITSGNYTFDSAAVSGAGTVELAGATTRLKGTTGSGRFSVDGGNVELDTFNSVAARLALNSGTVASTNGGSAEVVALDWSGGTLNAKVKSAGATFVGGPKSLLAGADLTLQGTTTWDGSQINATSGARLRNDSGATFANTGDGVITSGAVFTNVGTFEKTHGHAGAATEIQARFDSTGQIKATAGTLKLSGGGSSSNAVTIGSGARIEIAGADFAFNGGAINGSSGKLELADKITTFSSATSGDAEVALTGANATARFSGTHVGSGKLSLATGTVDGTGTAEFGSLDWSGGVLNARVKSNGAVTLGGDIKELAGELTLNGNTTWAGSQISATGAARLRNESGKVFLATGDGLITNGGSAIFTNAGTFEKNSRNGGVSEIQTRFDSTGSVKATYGTLKLAGGGTSSGNVTVESSGRLEIAGSNGYAFENATLHGSGTVDLKGGSTTFKNAGGTARVALNGGNAHLDSSILTASALSIGSGAVTSTNGGSADVGWLEWTGGSVGAKVKAANATLSGGGKTLASGAELLLGGSTAWDGSQISAQGNARIRNEANGVFFANADGTLANSGSAVFTNDGTFIKSSSNGGATQIQSRFENNSLVNVNAGKLQLSGGGRNAANAAILVAASAALEIAGDLELAANSALAGNGVGRLLSGTLNAQGTVAIRSFEFHGGSLAGSNAFTGIVEWHGGNWNSAQAGATTSIVQGAVLNFRGNSNHDFSGRSILNSGIVNWHSGSLRGGNNSSFVNNAVFNDLNGGSKSLATAGGGATFTNNGEYRKTQGGITTVDVPFTNNGALKISSGTLVFNSTFTNNGVFNLTNGAQAQFVAPVSFGSSPLTGVGTITATAVTAGGIVAPGVSPGSLTITGSLTLLNTSTLLIELGGPNKGTDYDFLGVGLGALLAGNLNVSFLNGYQWNLPANATFTILTANSGLTGAFANILSGSRLSTIDGGATFQVNYGAGSAFDTNSVVLSNFIVAVPEPSTYAMLGLGGIVVLLSLRRRKKTAVRRTR